MGQPLGGTPQRVGVHDGQVFAGLDLHVSGPNQQLTVARERLRTVRHAAVLQHGTRVVDGHVRRLRQRHFVPVHLDDTAHPQYLVGRPLVRVQFEIPVQVIGYPDFVRLVLGPAAAAGAMRLQTIEFGPDVRVVLLLVQAPDHRNRLITGMRDREIVDLCLHIGFFFTWTYHLDRGWEGAVKNLW